MTGDHDRGHRDEESSFKLLEWRMASLEDQLSKLTRDVGVLNKAMYMFLGAVTLVQVILPLLEKYGK